ncbi:MAG: hypothetical protein HQK53_08175, partial [Oligoflexia bacterium]|nr:hypothetical protein [Oligoflexia bacterium]
LTLKNPELFSKVYIEAPAIYSVNPFTATSAEINEYIKKSGGRSYLLKYVIIPMAKMKYKNAENYDKNDIMKMVTDGQHFSEATPKMKLVIGKDDMLGTVDEMKKVHRAAKAAGASSSLKVIQKFNGPIPFPWNIFLSKGVADHTVEEPFKMANFLFPGLRADTE